MVTSITRDTISAIHTRQENRESPSNNDAHSAAAAAAAAAQFRLPCLHVIKTTMAKKQSQASIRSFIHSFVSLSVPRLCDTPALLYSYCCNPIEIAVVASLQH